MYRMHVGLALAFSIGAGSLKSVTGTPSDISVRMRAPTIA